MKKPSAKARKGTQGKKRAAPGKVNAKGTRVRAKKEHRPPKKMRARAVQKEKKPAKRDAMGRRLRPVREWLEELKKLRRPVRMVGDKFALEWAFTRFAENIRTKLRLGKKSMAELCWLKRGTVQNVEKGEHSTTLGVVDLYCCGANLTYLDLARILMRLIKEAPGG